MSSVSVNPPKTPVTKGSKGIAAAAVPNVCKMPGPPAPFVPTPLPNIGKSDKSPEGYSTTVKIEGQFVAIKGATFGSMGDIASKGTGGGIISANVEGPTAFVAPGSMNVKIEGKNVHLLSDATTNNNGSPPNASTPAVMQAPGAPAVDNPLAVKCANAPASNPVKMTDCEKKQICQKCDDLNNMAKDGKLQRRAPADQEKARALGDAAASTFKSRLGNSLKGKGPFGKKIPAASPESLAGSFTHSCAHEEWMTQGSNPKMPGLSPDHVQDVQFGGSPDSSANLRMMSSKANEWIGRVMKDYKPETHTGVKPDCCD